eukprot:scaffold300_cov20-Tisochrysis_lutea.AAC.4
MPACTVLCWPVLCKPACIVQSVLCKQASSWFGEPACLMFPFNNKLARILEVAYIMRLVTVLADWYMSCEGGAHGQPVQASMNASILNACLPLLVLVVIVVCVYLYKKQRNAQSLKNYYGCNCRLQVPQPKQARETVVCSPPANSEHVKGMPPAVRWQLKVDELIREVTINCAERGLLLLRVRDEMRMTIAAYQTLYESAVAFGMRKALQTEQGWPLYDAMIGRSPTGWVAFSQCCKQRKCRKCDRIGLHEKLHRKQLQRGRVASGSATKRTGEYGKDCLHVRLQTERLQRWCVCMTCCKQIR